MVKKRRVWRASDQPLRHRHQIDRSERETGTASQVGAPLETRPGVKQRLLQGYVDATKRMQTPDFWRKVWEDS